MPRSYIPLIEIAYPPHIHFANGVRLVNSTELPTADLRGLEEVFNQRELRQLREWHLALLYESGASEGFEANTAAASKLADVQLALQVIAPIGNELSVCFHEGAMPGSIAHSVRFEQLHGTAWSRMSSFTGMTVASMQLMVDGIVEMLESGDARLINPLRMLEHGLISTNPYIRIFLWASAIDGILMAVKEDTFVLRIQGLLGADTLVFPQSDGVFFARPTSIRDVVRDLFELRSQIAHGRPIARKYWQQRADLQMIFPESAYGFDTPRYLQLLEESALSLLRQVLHKIVLDGLATLYREPKLWRQRLRG